MPIMSGMVVMSVMMMATKTHSISLLQPRVYASHGADVKRRPFFVVSQLLFFSGTSVKTCGLCVEESPQKMIYRRLKEAVNAETAEKQLRISD